MGKDEGDEVTDSLQKLRYLASFDAERLSDAARLNEFCHVSAEISDLFKTMSAALMMADETFRDLGWHDKWEVTSKALSIPKPNLPAPLKVKTDE